MRNFFFVVDPTSNSGAGETELSRQIIPNGSLKDRGDSAEFTYVLALGDGATAHGVDLKIYSGNNVLFTVPTFTTDSAFVTQCLIELSYKRSVSSGNPLWLLKITRSCESGVSSSFIDTSTDLGGDYASDLEVGLTAQGEASNDAILRYSIGEVAA